MNKTRSNPGPGIFIVIASILVIICILGLVTIALNLPIPVSAAPTGNSKPVPQQFLIQTSVPLPITETVTPIPLATETSTELPTPTSTQWVPLPPVSQLSSRGLLTNGNRDQYRVALTFDVCQRDNDLAGYDTEIVQVLNETQTPATFFIGGLWMRDHQAETLELAGNPLFELGNHSWSHEDFSVIPRDEMAQEVLQTQQMMYDLLGYQTNLFRLPYGNYTDEALNLINDQGMYIIHWDDVSGDPDPDIDAKSMTSWVLQQAQPGSIIIMHANGRGWHTAEALPGIIQALRQEGYTLVTVSELLNIPPYK